MRTLIFAILSYICINPCKSQHYKMGLSSLVLFHVVPPAVAIKNIRTDITVIQEMNWKGQGYSKIAGCDIYYSGQKYRSRFGCGFVVSSRLSKLVEFKANNAIRQKFSTLASSAYIPEQIKRMRNARLLVFRFTYKLNNKYINNLKLNKIKY